MKRHRAAAAAVGLSLAACNGAGSSAAQPSAPPGTTISRMTVSSKAFGSGAAIPIDHSCDGADRSPALAWSAPPQGTQSIALIVHDPDAPSGDFTHWVVFDLPPTTVSLAEGADIASVGGEEGTNSFGRGGYSGPCPPKGEEHRYIFQIFALNAPLHLNAGVSREAIDGAMAGRVIGAGALIGTFGH